MEKERAVLLVAGTIFLKVYYVETSLIEETRCSPVLLYWLWLHSVWLGSSPFVRCKGEKGAPVSQGYRHMESHL